MRVLFPISRPSFRNWPIRRKLLFIIMATTSIALVIAAAGILLYDTVLFRQYLSHDLSTLSQIVADSSTGALAFDDAKVASETLNALRARSHLINACLYRADGTVLATYFRDKALVGGCPRPEAAFAVRAGSVRMDLSRPVLLAGRRIGTVTLSYDLEEVGARRRLYGAVVIFMLLIAAIIAAIFSARLTSIITSPIFSLVRTASAVSESRDYHLRAEKETEDETGSLVDAFNEMLARIGQRDNELRRSLEELERVNRQLAQSNEDLERFAFVASHDLQEPLRMVTVYLQLLQKRSLIDGGPDAAQFLANIMAGTRRMRELLSDLRAYAELGAETEYDTVVDLNRVVVKALENLALAITSNHAEITADRLPAIRAYEGHLIPLFQNLIGNAIKYRSERTPRVHITCCQTANQVEFAVSDNGIGIAPEYHAKVFVPFKRLHGPDIPGSGIGLSICNRVVERYGGRIWVESKLGEGSTFRFTLPATLMGDPSGNEGYSDAAKQQASHPDH